MCGCGVQSSAPAPLLPEHRCERKQALARFLPSHFPAHRAAAIASGRYPHRVIVNPPATAGGPVPRPEPVSHGWLGARQPQLGVPGACRSVYAIATSASRGMVASQGPCGVGVRRSAITWPKPNWRSIRRSDHAWPKPLCLSIRRSDHAWPNPLCLFGGRRSALTWPKPN